MPSWRLSSQLASHLASQGVEARLEPVGVCLDSAVLAALLRFQQAATTALSTQLQASSQARDAEALERAPHEKVSDADAAAALDAAELTAAVDVATAARHRARGATRAPSWAFGSPRLQARRSRRVVRRWGALLTALRHGGVLQGRRVVVQLPAWPLSNAWPLSKPSSWAPSLLGAELGMPRLLHHRLSSSRDMLVEASPLPTPAELLTP